jgi:rRNA methylases
MINSNKNPQIKNLMLLQKKSKARKEQGVFIVEGIKIVMETSLERLEKIYISESFSKIDEYRGFLESLKYEILSDSIFAAVADTVTPQGILAIVKRNIYSVEKIITDETKIAHILVLESLQDPGNLGTIIRTAEAAGVTGIIVNDDTVDVYNPKVIRSTMGAIYRVPIVYSDNLGSDILKLKREGIKVYAAHLKGENAYYEENYKQGTAFIIGNEGKGLSQEIADLADCYVKIPMCGEVESLNAAVASSLLMYETMIQRLKG